MKRIASVIGMPPENADVYEELHAAVWPAVLARLSESHVANYSIYRDGEMLFSLPKLCKWFSEQKRPLDLLVKLVRDLRDPKNGMQTTKKLVGLSRVDTFPEKDLLTWLVKMKFTAAASTAARIVELLQKDYVICEAKKGNKIVGISEGSSGNVKSIVIYKNVMVTSAENGVWPPSCVATR